MPANSFVIFKIHHQPLTTAKHGVLKRPYDLPEHRALGENMLQQRIMIENVHWSGMSAHGPFQIQTHSAQSRLW